MGSGLRHKNRDTKPSPSTDHFGQSGSRFTLGVQPLAPVRGHSKNLFKTPRILIGVLQADDEASFISQYRLHRAFELWPRH
jgi:hypothetical protein